MLGIAIGEEKLLHNQVSLMLFIENVHLNNQYMYNEILKTFISNTMENQCALFLISPLPLAEKEEKYLTALPAEYTNLKPYMIGEHYMIANDHENAKKYFNQCIDSGNNSLEKNRWFVLRAIKKIEQMKQ